MSERPFSRREFLRSSAEASALLVVAVHLPLTHCDAGARPYGGGIDVGGLHPSAWLTIDTAGTVSVVVDKHELGQGVLTSLPMIVAEELEADWAKVRPLPVPEDPSDWAAHGGRDIFTGGSTSVRTSWEPLRKAGAAAREMLRSAAAARWQVPVEECTARKGAILHEKTGRRLDYGTLVPDAAQLPVPANPHLKPNSAFSIVGKPKPRVEGREKVTGTLLFASDLDLPGMLVASVERPPAYGAVLRSVDDAAARQVPGVVNVLRVPQGVAVVAKNTWAALKGREALRLDWDTAPARGLSSDAIFRELAAPTRAAGQVTRNVGDAPAALRTAAKQVEAEYFLPFMDHVPMEPMVAAALVRDGAVEVWAPTQVASEAQGVAAQVAGVPVGRVRLHSLLAGGGFGRRLTPDDVVLAVTVAKQVPGTPVKVVWTRADSIRNGTYRPLTYHHLQGGLDAAGNPVAWVHHIAGAGERGLIGDGNELPYAIPNIRADVYAKDIPVPTGAWRSVTYTHMGFVVDGFMDELAAAAGKDPYRFRRDLLAHDPKLLACLDLVAEKAGWGKPLPKGYGRGIAAASSFGSHAAEVAEVSVSPDGEVKVHRVVAAVHVGTVVNPPGLVAQVESAVTLALSFTLKHGITLRDGAVQESNFHDYPLVRIDEMPPVEVHVVPSQDAPTGIGEPPVPPLAPAVVNAIFAATGKRVRRLPVDPAALRA
jgi:isoquinoline 1-oxidoreductase beta subunit